MIVLVPLSRFRIVYEVAAGRPFSQFERLILRAIKEGASELSELRETFQVHPRLLIEGLVTLTHAGWLAIGGPGHGGFVLTSGGHEAASSDQPPSTTEVTSRHASVVMERISGALIANNEVRFVSRKELGDVWDRAIRLPPEITGNELDEGQVQHLLPRRQGEWLRWIGPIDMLTKGANWLPVDVDIQIRNVVGLPDSWILRLQAAIITRASRVADTTPAEEMERSGVVPPFVQQRLGTSPGEKGAGGVQLPGLKRPTTVSREDFCFTIAQHEGLIATAINEAQSSIFVASTCPSIDKLEDLRSSIEGALKRGVNVDLLFGAMASASEEFRAVTDWSSKMAYEARQVHAGRLRFSRQPSNFLGNLLLWDGRSGWSGCIGSYKWFEISEEPEGTSFPRDVSVRISEPGIVAALARCAIGVWSAVDTEMLSSTADRWRGIAAELDMAASGEAPHQTNAMVCLVLDGDHKTLISEWGSSARSKILFASRQLELLTEIGKSDQDIDAAETVTVDIVYGWTDKEEDWLTDVSRRVEERRGSLRRVEDFHGELLMRDESACVTSFNILGSTASVGLKGSREVGIVIEGEELVDWLWEKFKSE